MYTFRFGRCIARIKTARKTYEFADFESCQFLKAHYLCHEKVENIMVFQIQEKCTNFCTKHHGKYKKLRKNIRKREF